MWVRTVNCHYAETHQDYTFAGNKGHQTMGECLLCFVINRSRVAVLSPPASPYGTWQLLPPGSARLFSPLGPPRLFFLPFPIVSYITSVPILEATTTTGSSPRLNNLSRVFFLAEYSPLFYTYCLNPGWTDLEIFRNHARLYLRFEHNCFATRKQEQSSYAFL